jgi:hypothetical protein
MAGVGYQTQAEARRSERVGKVEWTSGLSYVVVPDNGLPQPTFSRMTAA